MKKLLILLAFIFLSGCASYYLPHQNEFYAIKRMETTPFIFDCSDKAELYKNHLVKNGIKAEVVVVRINTYDEILHRVEKKLHALVKYQNPDTLAWHYADPTLAFHNGIPVNDTDLKELQYKER